MASELNSPFDLAEHRLIQHQTVSAVAASLRMWIVLFLQQIGWKCQSIPAVAVAIARKAQKRLCAAVETGDTENPTAVVEKTGVAVVEKTGVAVAVAVDQTAAAVAYREQLPIFLE